MDNKVAVGGVQGSVTMRFLSAISSLPPAPPLRKVDERLVLCCGVALGMAILATASVLLKDPDTLWHLKLGDIIIATHRVPDHDLFSYTMAGAPYYDMQWLSQVLMSLSFELGGFGGLVVLTALAAALAFALLYRELLRRLNSLTALVLVGIAFVVCLPHLSCRPHVLVSPILILWTTWLIRSAEVKRAPPLPLLPLMMIWANMHGSFLFGLALIFPFALEAMFRAQNQLLPLAWHWSGFAGFSVAAASLSPYGIRQLTAPLRVLDLGKAATYWIVEMRPQDFSEPNLFELFLLFALGCALFSGITIPATRIVVLLLLLHLALSHVRHMDFLGLAGPLVVAESIARRFPEGEPRSRPKAFSDSMESENGSHMLFCRIFASMSLLRNIARDMRSGTHFAGKCSNLWLTTASFGICLAALAQTALVLQNSALRPPSANVPRAAFLAAKAASLKGRLFNDFNFGGYLISIGEPTFIDGRAEFFGAERLEAFGRTVQTQDSGELARFLDSNHIDWTLLGAKRPAAKVLDHLPGWQRIYGDADAVVHARLPTQPQQTNG